MKIQNEICDICMHQNNYELELQKQLKEELIPVTKVSEMRAEFYKMREVPCITLNGYIVAICKKHIQEMMEAFNES